MQAHGCRHLRGARGVGGGGAGKFSLSLVFRNASEGTEAALGPGTSPGGLGPLPPGRLHGDGPGAPVGSRVSCLVPR